MVGAPFTLIIFYSDFDLPQHLLTALADRRTKSGYQRRGIEIKDAQKILMLKVFVRFKAAAGHERVGDADNGGVSERHSDVEIIVFL